MPNRGAVFQRVGSVGGGKNPFNLSHEKKFTCDFGQLIPVCFIECTPGDVFKIRNSVLVRFQPLVHPIMHEINVDTHYFFVPTRLIFGNSITLDNENKMEQPNRWERFITKGKDGNDNTSLPIWHPPSTTKYKLWDYFGLPLIEGLPGNISTSSFLPIDFAKRCYNFVWQEYFRDENYQKSWFAKYAVNGISIVGEGFGDEFAKNEEILNRNWTKDYFTSARPFQQKGTSPSFDIAGSLSVGFNPSVTVPKTPVAVNPTNAPTDWTPTNQNRLMFTFEPGMNHSNFGTPVYDSPTAAILNTRFANLYITGQKGANTNASFPANPVTTEEVDITSQLNSHLNVQNSMVLNADINDIRTSVQIQKWLERNARAGTRYTEFLMSHHQVSPSDARLDRPEYIGGSKQPVIISEVLQTSNTVTTSAQGNMAGHGISANVTKIGNYRVLEDGYIIGIMSVMPRPAYQNGIHRTFLRRSPYDFYFREFANLSEREILGAELCFTGNDDKDGKMMAFQGQYDELRIMPDQVCADMRDSFNTWHLGRIFDPNNPPLINSNFLEVDSQTGGASNPLKRVFTFPGERGLLVNYSNIITALRQMPVNPEPGLMDHF